MSKNNEWNQASQKIYKIVTSSKSPASAAYAALDVFVFFVTYSGLKRKDVQVVIDRAFDVAEMAMQENNKVN